ncbi:unnamed protein product [Nezara viridula]|uniref:Uncharacterized protein n=1 Tax=Nezara viridula TaxID=85310 RepID=A0A9P0H5U7_NEZVI|nr:unnamed protein product [Nezara viridula]
MASHKATRVVEDPSKKFTSFGVSYATLEAEKREKEQASKTMIETIRNTLNGVDEQRQIPEGYKHEASEWSSRTHGIPINDPNWNEGLKNPEEIMRFEDDH